MFGHSVGDGLIVAALAALFGAYLYFKHSERKRRLEIIHEERMAAIDKGIPLPELPLEPVRVPAPVNPGAVLMHGIVWIALGIGAMVTLRLLVMPIPGMWSLPVPLVFLGLGLVLYYALASVRSR
jgi:hypothetical protein